MHAEFVGRSRYTNQGQRVVAGQRLMQQASDIFLGWQRTTGIDGVERDFYVRQLRDWKGSLEIDELRPEGLRSYGEVCAWCLARAHARSGDRIAIAGYLGSSPAFENALAEFGEAYADVNESDHGRLAEAAADGPGATRSRTSDPGGHPAGVIPPPVPAGACRAWTARAPAPGRIGAR